MSVVACSGELCNQGIVFVNNASVCSFQSLVDSYDKFHTTKSKQ